MPMDVQAPGFEFEAALRAHELSAIDGLLHCAFARQIVHEARGAAPVVRAPATPEEKVAC